MKINPSTFIWCGDNDNGLWIDSLFLDRSPNNELREWRLCRNTITGEKYAQLLRANGPEDEFDFSAILPSAFIQILEQAT